MFRIACWAVFWCVTMACTSFAQEKPLKLSIRREWEGARSSAPLSLRAFAKWQRPELLEGRLRVQAFVDTRRISEWTGNEIALADSEQFVWMMSPRPIMTETTRYVLETELLSDRPGLDMELLDVEVPVRSRRVMVVALIVEHGTSVPAGLGSVAKHNAFEDAISLQNFVSAEDAAYLHLHLSRVEPKDFPDQPLRLLGLDAVIVPADMLGRLKNGQLESLHKWLAAGGSMLVLRSGLLTEDAGDWLKDHTLSPWPRHELRNRELPDNLSIFDVGLGRLLVLEGGLDGESVEWIRSAGHLLRLRPEQTNEIVQKRKLLARQANSNPDHFWEFLEPRGRLTLVDHVGKTNLQKLLLPDSIRGMPFWLAATVMGLCLLAIGPLDYWVLGVLRKRRWTWVVFPLVALGFTGWMAQLAADHNGKNDARNWISIVDVTPSGEVLRTTRLELTYGASGRVVPHHVTNQWWCDLRPDDLDSIWETSTESGHGLRLAYSGAVPSSYTVQEPVQQWATRMQRVTTLGADPALDSYPLPRVDWKPMESARSQNAVLAAAMQKMSPTIQSQLPGALWGIARPGERIQWDTNSSFPVEGTRLRTIADQVLPELLTAPGVNDVGIFSLQTELSPTAGPDCEDLVLTSRHCGLILQEVEAGRYLLTRVIFPTVE